MDIKDLLSPKLHKTASCLMDPGSVKSVHWVAGRLGFYSQSGHIKDFRNSIRSFRARRSAQAEVRRVLRMCCSSCVSLNSVQSFVIENCNGPIENGLNQSFPNWGSRPREGSRNKLQGSQEVNICTNFRQSICVFSVTQLRSMLL